MKVKKFAYLIVISQIIYEGTSFTISSSSSRSGTSYTSLFFHVQSYNNAMMNKPSQCNCDTSKYFQKVSLMATLRQSDETCSEDDNHGVLELHQAKNNNDTSSSSFSSSQQTLVNRVIKASQLLTKDLSILPLLSLLSGLSPSMQIIAESHISRLPDCPIAHDIDTMLLWPAVAVESMAKQEGGALGAGGEDAIVTSVVPGTIFQAPFAAVTDESLYDVNWIDVWKTFFDNVGLSLCISFLLSFLLVWFVENINANNVGGGEDELMNT